MKELQKLIKEFIEDVYSHLENHRIAMLKMVKILAKQDKIITDMKEELQRIKENKK